METEKMNFRAKIRNANQKIVMSSLSIIVIALLIVISSLFNAGIDPSYWGSKEFISNMLVTLSICIIGMANGNAEGDSYYKNKVDGLYQTTLIKYKLTRNKINGYVDKFSYWSENLYKKELYKKQFRYLRNNFGIKQADKIMKLDRSEILLLVKPQKFKDTYFNSLNEEQIKACIKVVDGKIRLKYINDSYFLNALSKSKNMTPYEQSGFSNKSRNKKITQLTGYRLLTTLIVGLIFVSLTINLIDEASQAQAWVTLFSRLWTLTNSVMWGVFTANDILKDDCIYLDYKVRILDTFYLETIINKTFISKTQEEIAKEEYEKTIVEGKNTKYEKEINYEKN